LQIFQIYCSVPDHSASKAFYIHKQDFSESSTDETDICHLTPLPQIINTDGGHSLSRNCNNAYHIINCL